MIRKTQTICTIGPASEKPEVLEALVVGGMNIARLNFSHATFEQYEKLKTLLTHFNKKHNKNVKIMMDLQGPRIRVGILPRKGIKLTEGQIVIFSTNPANKKAIYINDPYLHKDVLLGHPMFLANGDMELIIRRVIDTEITAEVVRGGILYSRKGVNLPDTTLTTTSLTEKDLLDIEFGVYNTVDYVAMSFVKDARDIEKLRGYLGKEPIQIVAKIERKLAIEHLTDIIKSSDLIMVARGDLGIELPLEDLPLLQKDIIKKTNTLRKKSIVATQMLMSMVAHYRPTRAEVSDVANAVLDGAWGLMLSDETAFGEFPIESLNYLVKTIEKVEEFQG